MKKCPRSDDEQHLPSLPIPPSSSTRLYRETRKIVSLRSITTNQPPRPTNFASHVHACVLPTACSTALSSASRSTQPILIYCQPSRQPATTLPICSTRSTHRPFYCSIGSMFSIQPILIYHQSSHQPDLEMFHPSSSFQQRSMISHPF